MTKLSELGKAWGMYEGILKMGFWHTGYAEFHEPTGLGEMVYAPPPPKRYICEVCAKSYTNLERLRKHRFEKHPLRQPTLLIGGHPQGSASIKILTALDVSSVSLEDVTECFLNGKKIEPASLGWQLSEKKLAFLDLELRNGSARTRLKLDFRIADGFDLAGVEDALSRLAHGRDLSLDSIARFINDCKSFPSAGSYCDGVCHYLYGVMAKERLPDSGLKYEQYAERYLQAVDELSGIDRPLARAIRSLIAFHFNQFNLAEAIACDGILRNVAGAFGGLLEGFPWHFDETLDAQSVGTVENLLTDQDTLEILTDAGLGLLSLKGKSVELLKRTRRYKTGGYDRMKRILLTCEALAATNDERSYAEARKLARELGAMDETTVWNKAIMERLENHER